MWSCFGGGRKVLGVLILGQGSALWRQTGKAQWKLAPAHAFTPFEPLWKESGLSKCFALFTRSGFLSPLPASYREPAGARPGAPAGNQAASCSDIRLVGQFNLRGVLCSPSENKHMRVLPHVEFAQCLTGNLWASPLVSESCSVPHVCYRVSECLNSPNEASDLQSLWAV